ncbi:zf-RING-7 domain-containing protein [Sulfidibacter corallicola]|uniref:C4-type zinc ribbon domain-containing protein n=1 Tax=Sulfidibacter corallicola TaxID=2818388 RepID=A0A8A4TVD0_SULCO|nr:C4-type zinc ribbon domain-containing protein [Sulfidibacter corallicola]QTD53317.1 hypothetical protein J3U87_12750 [Sulfidibacter corallicola]
MRAALKALRDYQDVLVRIAELDRLLSFVPAEIVEMEKEWKAVQERVQELKEKRETKEAEIKEREIKLAEATEKSQKFEKDLHEVTNSKEYHAVLKEIDVAKKQIHTLEEEISERRNDIKEIDGNIEELTTLEKESGEKHGTAMAKHQEAMIENKEEKGEKELVKDKLAQDVPVDLRRKFERIAARRNGVGLALCVSSVCQACHVRVRQNIVDQLRRFNRVITCDSCKRILYFADTE